MPINLVLLKVYDSLFEEAFIICFFDLKFYHNVCKYGFFFSHPFCSALYELLHSGDISSFFFHSGIVSLM